MSIATLHPSSRPSSSPAIISGAATRTPRTYLRKSGKGDATGTFAMQAATILRLSEADAEDPVKLPPVGSLADAREHPAWMTDWAVSGRARIEDRPAYVELLADIEAGRVSTVYAFAEDRLGRDVEYGARLLKLCDRTGTRIVTPSGVISEPEQRLVTHVRWTVSEEEHTRITARNRAKTAREWERGDDRGEPPYGYVKVRLSEPGTNRAGKPAAAGAMVDRLVDPEAIETVAKAFREAGSVLGAAKLLNALGVLSPKDWRRQQARDPLPIRGDAWTARAVLDVLARNGIAERQQGPGRPAMRIRSLSKLLRCPCGHLMSPNRAGWTCRLGLADPAHGPYNVSERAVMSWAKEEADRLAMPRAGQTARMQTSRAEERAQLIERKRRAGLAFADGNLADDDYRARIAEADQRIAQLDAEEAASEARIPERIDWTWPEPELNAVLRALWPGGIRCELIDGRIVPVAAGWADPSWRRPD